MTENLFFRGFDFDNYLVSHHFVNQDFLLLSERRERKRHKSSDLNVILMSDCNIIFYGFQFYDPRSGIDTFYDCQLSTPSKRVTKSLTFLRRYIIQQLSAQSEFKHSRSIIAGPKTDVMHIKIIIASLSLIHQHVSSSSDHSSIKSKTNIPS